VQHAEVGIEQIAAASTNVLLPKFHHQARHITPSSSSCYPLSHSINAIGPAPPKPSCRLISCSVREPFFGTCYISMPQICKGKQSQTQRGACTCSSACEHALTVSSHHTRLQDQHKMPTAAVRSRNITCIVTQCMKSSCTAKPPPETLPPFTSTGDLPNIQASCTNTVCTTQPASRNPAAAHIQNKNPRVCHVSTRLPGVQCALCASPSNECIQAVHIVLLASAGTAAPGNCRTHKQPCACIQNDLPPLKHWYCRMKGGTQLLQHLPARAHLETVAAVHDMRKAEPMYCPVVCASMFWHAMALCYKCS
jgi:hypothetical protein